MFKYPNNQRALHMRPCMIIMLQIYQHEILFQAHEAMGHQGFAMVLARTQNVTHGLALANSLDST